MPADVPEPEIKALFDADKGAGADADARRRRVDVARLSATLEPCGAPDEFTRVTAVTVTLAEFVALAGARGRRCRRRQDARERRE